MPDSMPAVFPSSAVRYMVEVRMPPIPAVIASMDTDKTNCRRPIPAAPICPDKYTWKPMDTMRRARLAPVSSRAL